MSENHRSPRSEEDYQLDVLRRGLKVLEALEGTNFEPVSIQRVSERSGQSYDFCRRALLTFKLAHYATQADRGWQVGPRLLKFSTRFNDLCVAAVTAESSATAERKS